MELLKAHMV